MRAKILLTASAFLALTACDTTGTTVIEGGQYWQRVNASSATYTRGPKAQQMLNQDLAACVVEMRELDRLGAIREPIKTDFTGRVLAQDNQGRNNLNPDGAVKNGTLYSELADYSDFDGCMHYKGWERVAYVPYDVGREAQQTYINSNANFQHNQEVQATQKENASGLNQ